MGEHPRPLGTGSRARECDRRSNASHPRAVGCRALALGSRRLAVMSHQQVVGHLRKGLATPPDRPDSAPDGHGAAPDQLSAPPDEEDAAPDQLFGGKHRLRVPKEETRVPFQDNDRGGRARGDGSRSDDPTVRGILFPGRETEGRPGEAVIAAARPACFAAEPVLLPISLCLGAGAQLDPVMS